MKWTNDEINLAIKMIDKSYSFLKISLNLNRSHTSVSKKMNNLGYKSGFNYNKDKTKYSKYNWKLIQQEYINGLSYIELRLKFNLSTRAIIWAKQNNKLIFRTPSEGLKLAWKNKKYKSSKQTGFNRYKQLCKFKFKLNDFPERFDFSLIEKYGWYKASNKGNNLNGISRDHMYSIKQGFEQNIIPYYINHPANCKLMRHVDNNKKNTNCSITLNQLMIKIENWS